MVVTSFMRNNSDAVPMVGGGIVGVGGPLALREVADEQFGPLAGVPGSILARLTTPSVLWGLGTGAATGALWALDVGPDALQKFYLTHSATSIPTAVASAAFPKAGGSGGDAQAQRQRTLAETRPSSGSSPSANGSRDEFAASGGTSPETQPAN